MNTETDCRTPIGIAVDLIDALIAISRVLNDLDSTIKSSTAVAEALKDLRQDEDVQRLFNAEDL